MKPTRIAFIGAGNIAQTHAAAVRSISGLTLSAVVDPVTPRASAFAKRWGIERVYETVDCLLRHGETDAAHVLVPPPAHEFVAGPLLAAGIDVLLEKPMAQSSTECEALQRAAQEGRAKLRVNHNFVHHPAHREAKRMLAANRIGPLRHVWVRYNLGLRQLAARQLGHWMFDRPLNLLLEQAVHPLSQIVDFAGTERAMSALVPPPKRLGKGQQIRRRWIVSLETAGATATLYMSLGESFPSWGAVLVGDDGLITVDYLNNQITSETHGRVMDPWDSFRDGSQRAFSLHWQSARNLVASTASLLKIAPRSDVFFRSMVSSISQFYWDREHASGDLVGANGRAMVELCERIVRKAEISDHVPAQLATSPSNINIDVAVIGGTGFIGAPVVERLLALGHRVSVLARNTKNLPTTFADPRIALFQGDARNPEDVNRAIMRAGCVINLAHGGGGGSRAEIEANLVGAAKTVAERCMAAGARLIFVSSIAALYLGNPKDTVIGATPPDDRPDERADYARAKVLAERELMALRQTSGLRLCVLRPGVVIGRGGNPFHSGVGFYNHENHCLGWNQGTNPLPLVLVDDVADAIARAADATNVHGKNYNLVGDVRLTARDYINELARATGRPLRYHPQSVRKLYGTDVTKVLIKRVTGRIEPWPTLRDLRSRGMVARFDCADAVRDLSWIPIQDRTQFVTKAFPVDGD